MICLMISSTNEFNNLNKFNKILEKLQQIKLYSFIKITQKGKENMLTSFLRPDNYIHKI